MNQKSKTKLSSFMTKILRHSPKEYGVEMDEWGFCKIEDLVEAIKGQEYWKSVNKELIIEVAETCPKQRYKIDSGKIRARYGHSISILQVNSEKSLPDFLFHGTNAEALVSIKDREQGILTMNRQFVHLSETVSFATLAAKRRKGPYLLKVDTTKAKEMGVEFFFAGNEVWLASPIPPTCIVEVNQI
ncbi:RNA 2'-phosphotransferase [[Brevibacterium] frigoritolerans]|nr:RNA 2'-phosphotransferase [Peribacillus frigoritolerans]